LASLIVIHKVSSSQARALNYLKDEGNPKLKATTPGEKMSMTNGGDDS
jgi:hypothetical protein